MTTLTTALAPGSAPARAEASYAARRRRKLIVAALVFAGLAALPYGIRDVYLQNVLILTLMYAALSQSWNILGGYCGQVSLGHALYFGFGAYATSVLFVNYGVLPWFGMLAGGALSAVVALILGYPCFRLAGHYFSIATIVIAEIGLLLVHNWDFVGGAMGIQWPFNPDSWWTLQFARDRARAGATGGARSRTTPRPPRASASRCSAPRWRRRRSRPSSPRSAAGSTRPTSPTSTPRA
jgi:branched-chain amino acid transport system permease protein